MYCLLRILDKRSHQKGTQDNVRRPHCAVYAHCIQYHGVYIYQVERCIGSIWFAGVVIGLLACVAQSQLTQTSVEAFSRTLTGSVLAYNVSNEAEPSQPPTFDLWSYLEVRIVVGDFHADQLSFMCSSYI